MKSCEEVRGVEDIIINPTRDWTALDPRRRVDLQLVIHDKPYWWDNALEAAHVRITEAKRGDVGRRTNTARRDCIIHQISLL
jgi:hypothetical protein